MSFQGMSLQQLIDNWSVCNLPELCCTQSNCLTVFIKQCTFYALFVFQFQAHKTIISCFFPDIYTWDKIPSFLDSLPSDVLHALLHYLYTCSLPSNISDETARQLLRIVQLSGRDIGNLEELCTEFLEATAVKNSKSNSKNYLVLAITLLETFRF